MNTSTTVSQVAKGEFVKFKDTETAPVWVKGHYDRPSKTYSFTKADDTNHECFRKASATCFVGFTY
jgi:hypothetical protein